MIRLAIGLLFVATLAGCGDTRVVNLNLGSVSIGQQLIDLQAAKTAGVIDDAEYEVARAAILSFAEAHIIEDDEIAAKK